MFGKFFRRRGRKGEEAKGGSPEPSARKLGRLQKELYAEERKIMDLIEGGASQEQIGNALAELERVGMFSLAGRAAAEAGMTARAVENFEKAGRYDTAARFALRAGMAEKASEMYERAGMYWLAAETARKAGSQERAVGNFLRAHRYYYAAEAAAEGRMFEESMNIYAGIKNWFLAARMARRGGFHDKETEFYAKAIRHANKPEMYDHAAEIALEAGLPEKAAELYLKALDTKRADGILRQSVERTRIYRRVMRWFQGEGDHASALRLAACAGLTDELRYDKPRE